MFETIDQILEGIEAELSLMRELGVRLVPFDRELLREEVQNVREVPEVREVRKVLPKKEEPPSLNTQHSNFNTKSPPPEPSRLAALNSIKRGAYDFVFLHDKPLSEKGTETFEKIRAAMNLTQETAPLLTEYEAKTFPRAKLYIVMGPAALSKFMPGVRLSYFSFGKSAGGKDIHFTYSPEYFLRLDPKDKAVLLLKHKMWTALKNAMSRIS